MAHWIDNADSYICPVCRFEVNNPNRHHGRCPKCGFMDEKDIVSADVVEVVRCCDCQHCTAFQKEADSEVILTCFRHSFEIVDPTDYCSKGERKDNEV